MLASKIDNDVAAGPRAFDSFDPKSEKFVSGALLLLLVYVLVRNLIGAATKPLGFDELCTLAVSSQPTLSTLWGALAHAVDGNPPAFYLLGRTAAAFVHDKHIALRLPSILAFPCSLLCIFIFVKRHGGALLGFLCALLLLSTNLFHTFALEARPYALVFACISFALICYQRVPSLLWTALLAISLALAECLHYYALFAFIPFGIAESFFLLKTRRLRWAVWLALACGPIPLVFFWPLLSGVKAYYGSHFWAHYGLSSIPATYGSFFFVGGAPGAAIVAVCIAGMLGLRLQIARSIPRPERADDDEPFQTVLLLSLLALPFFGFAATRIMHTGMTDRYVLSALLAIPLCIACLLRHARSHTVALFAVFVFTSAVVHEYSFWSSLRAQSFAFVSPAAFLERFVGAGPADLPIAVSDGLSYVSYAYYDSPALAQRLIFISDPPQALIYAGTDNLDKNIQALSSYLPLHVVPFSEMQSRRAPFLLYSESSSDNFNWWPKRLTREGWTLRALALDQNRTLYLVTLEQPLTNTGASSKK
jgi:hypothetical protein